MEITQTMAFKPSPPIYRYKSNTSFGSSIKIVEKTVSPLGYLNLKVSKDFFSMLREGSKKINNYSFAECLERAKTFVKYDLILRQCGFEEVKPRLNITPKSVAEKNPILSVSTVLLVPLNK